MHIGQMALDAFTREMIGKGMFNEEQVAEMLEQRSRLSVPCLDQACEHCVSDNCCCGCHVSRMDADQLTEEQLRYKERE